MLPDKERFSDQRFNTIMFDQLLKTSCKDFLTNVKQARSYWIKNPKKFDEATAMSDFRNLYTKFSSAVDWEKAYEEQAKIIALKTELKDTKAQVAKLSPKPRRPQLQPALPGEDSKPESSRKSGSSRPWTTSSTCGAKSTAVRTQRESTGCI